MMSARTRARVSLPSTLLWLYLLGLYLLGLYLLGLYLLGLYLLGLYLLGLYLLWLYSLQVTWPSTAHASATITSPSG